MKIVNSGNSYRIYGDDLKTYDQLPAGTYSVCFSKTSGFYLEQHSELEVKEEKVYGVHLNKVNKVLNAFENTNRSLGVILSGDKGIGKSLFARILSNKSIEKGIPVIIVDCYIPGIASFIEEIEQEVLVFFDEFDKTFSKVSNDSADPQNETLSLFDGVAAGKKLFVITCNDFRKLNDFLINRPGRFHYHFRFDYPSFDEVKEYLRDKVKKEYWGQIEAVAAFSRKVKLNYDCLRAIAFELNTGETFESAIQDLNIMNVERESYNFMLLLEDGSVFTSECYADLFSDSDVTVYRLYSAKYKLELSATFLPQNIAFDNFSSNGYVDAENLSVEATYCDDYDAEEQKKLDAILEKTKISKLIIKQKKSNNFRYMI